jgi:hypothetical protein
LESAIYVHTHERASRWGREGRAAVFDHFENNLRGVSGATRPWKDSTY